MKPITILEQCKELFTSARSSIVEAMPLLHKISTENLWEGQYSSFGEYVDELGVSRGYASKLVHVWEHYALSGGVSQRNLSEIDAERLYLALKLPGTAEEQATKAKTLSRQELKSELALNEKGEEHTCEPVSYCRICQRRM